MKADITVKQFISILQTLDQDAKVCIAEMQDDREGFYYTAIEGSKSLDKAEYISNNGDVLIGKVLGLY